MPEYLRALVVLLLVAPLIFYLGRKTFPESILEKNSYDRRRNIWLTITCAAFLSQGFWIFVVLLSIALKYASKFEKNPVALFFLVLLAVPVLKVEVPGFAGIRSFIEIDYIRIITIAILLPVCVTEYKSRKNQPSSLARYEYFLVFYILLCLCLQALNDSFTGLIRAAIYWVVDVAIPYYAISRGVKDFKKFVEVVASIALSCFLVAAIATVEFFKSWLLYIPVNEALGISSTPFYLQRGDYVRAIGPTGQAIALGFVLVIGMSAYSYLKKHSNNRWPYIIGLFILLMGEVASLSKGPWLGLMLFYCLYFLTGGQVRKFLSRALLTIIPVVLFLATSEYGKKISAYLPFVGTLDTGSQTYRELLLEKSLEIIFENPFFGSTDFLLQMEDLRQGQGIIDLVNTYLIVALNTGLIGLGLYCAFFASVLLKLFRSIDQREIHSNKNLLGRYLFSIMSSALLMIFAVSPIAQIPIYIWTLPALAYSFLYGLKNMEQS
jgi:hypothetical protein